MIFRYKGAPDAETLFTDDPSYLALLVEKTGMSVRAVARKIGVSERLLHMNLSGERRLTYRTQYSIEGLVANGCGWGEK